MHADLKYVESLEKEIDELESDKAESSNIELKKLIEKGKGKYVETKFDKPYVVRQPNAQRIPKPSVLGKPAPFSDSLERGYFSKTKSVPKTNVLKGLSKPVTVQTLPQTARHAVVDSNHFTCVTKMLNDVNARTKKPKIVPISTRKPKGHANKSVATPHKKKFASKLTTQTIKSYYRMLYEKTSKTWKWWIEQQCPSGYKWVPKTKMQWIVQLILFIVDSGCTKHMMGNLKLLCNFVEKFLGTVQIGNDQFASIMGYGDLVQGNMMINRVYYVKGLNHNLFSVGQFCDADLEVAFRKSTCFVRDLQGNDLLTVPTGRYVVPTSRVIVPAGRYIVPTGSVIVATGRELKARTTLLQSIPNDHIADFHYMDDARDIWNAVKARFRGNAKSKKMRKSMLKQEFSEFRISEAEGVHKGYDRMQKILSQLKQLDAKPDAKEINLRFLRALPSSWFQVALSLKTKGGLEFLSFDDFYYKLKTLEMDIKGYSTFSPSQSAGPSHSAFVSAINTSKKMPYRESPNYSSPTTYSVPSNSKTGSHRTGNVIEDVLQSFVADTEPEQLAYEVLEQIEKLDLEEMDLKWQMAMLSVRVHKFKQKAGRKIDFVKKESARFNKQKVRCYKCQQRGHFATECRENKGNDKQRYSSFKNKEIGRKEEDSKALVTVDTLVDWSNHDSDSDEVITAKEFGMIAGANSEEANTPGDAGEFSLMGVTSEDDSTFGVFTTTSEDMKGRPTFHRFAKTDSMKVVPPPLTVDYTSLSDHSDLDESQMSYGTKSSTSNDPESVSNDFVSCDDSDKSSEVKTSDFASSDSSGKSLEHKPTDSTSCASTSSVSTSVNEAEIESNVGTPIKEPISHFRKHASCVSKFCFVCGSGTHLIKDYDFYEKQMANSTVGIGVVPAVRPQPIHTGKPKVKPVPTRKPKVKPVPTGKPKVKSVSTGNPKETPFSTTKDERIFDSGCSRSMTGNKDRLDDFQAIHGGKVTFRGDTECLVLSKDFKRPDDSMVVLKVPRKHNIYIINLNDLCPKGNLACLVAHASFDECVKWHRRMAHAHYKNMNRVFVTSPHNKTPNALLTGNIPTVSHLKPFGCHVTILNTSDHLGKFDGKADEGYIVGYSASNKAYKEYNGLGHEWYFDLDYLTDSLGYKHVSANNPAGTQGNKTNFAGTQDADSDSDGDEQVIIVPSYLPQSIQETQPIDTPSTPAGVKAVLLGRIPVPTGRVPVPAGSVPVPTGSITVPTKRIPVPTDDTTVPTDDVPVHSCNSTDSIVVMLVKVRYVVVLYVVEDDGKMHQNEFTGELTLLKSILPGIDETDYDFGEDIRLIEKLLYDNSSPCPPKEFVSANSDAENYPMPSGIEDKDYDFERDILIPKDLPSNNTLSFTEKESFYFDIPSFSRPPAKPPDGDTGILNIKMMGDISDQKAFMHKLMITLASHQEKSLDLLSHRGLKASQPFATCPMMIHGKNNPILDDYLSTHPSKRLHSFYFDDDDEDYTSAITPDEPVLSTEEPDNSLSMRDEHFDTIPATESNEFIKSSVKNLIPILSESEGIPDYRCDMPSHDNSLLLDVSKDQFEDFFESNKEFSSTDDDSFSFDKIDYRDEIKIAELKENLNGMSIEIRIKEKLLQQEQWDYLSTHPSKRLHSFCFDDDDEDYTSAITPDGPVLSTEEPDNSLSMRDEHFDTILATESDEFIKSSVKNLIPIPRESDFFLEVDAFLTVEDEFTSSQFTKSYLDLEGDMLLLEAFLNDDHFSNFKTKSSSTSLNSLLEETNNFDNSLPEFTTFLKVLFDAEYESDSSNDQSCSDEDVLEKIISKPLSEKEIIPMKSLYTHDASLSISSKIDSFLDEFTGELTLLKSISPGIDETDCDFEEDIRLIEKLLYDNSSPRPPKEFVSANSDAKIKSFSPSPILVKDSDSLIEEINLFCTSDYPMPSGIEDKDYDFERDILIPKDLPSNNTLSFAKKESLHFDIPSFSHPPAKPPDGDTGILNIKMMGDISDQ
nr:ribonuclease H-like domain-containing protein [Tanacetum cinerariifolium]